MKSTRKTGLQPIPDRLLVSWSAGFLVLSLSLWFGTGARAQNGGRAPVEVGEFMASGGRSSVTESWGTLDFKVTNRTNAAKTIRVELFYGERSDATPDV